MLKTKKLKPIHPGEILLEEFLKPLELSQNRLARDIYVSPRRINEIILAKSFRFLFIFYFYYCRISQQIILMFGKMAKHHIIGMINVI